MIEVPSFLEELISQIPAARLAMALGYEYLTPEAALRLRGGRKDRVILDGILEPWLAQHNAVQAGGTPQPFTPANIHEALRRLNDLQLQLGLVQASEQLYELLTLGTSLKQTVDGDAKSYSLHYIDWNHPERNVYHITEEFSIEKTASKETRRPDIILFVNGIPLVVIECKRPDLKNGRDEAVWEAVSQTIRNQMPDEIPHLFAYAQLLLGVSVNEARYSTTGAKKDFWFVWKEALPEAEVARAINTPLTPAQARDLYTWRDHAAGIQRYFQELDQAPRLPTPQDFTLYALLQPARLLKLIYQFILYDGGVKKIARYQQFFAVEETLARVAHLNAGGERTGGLIWHTTGSGKSLTMVMLAKALALHPNLRNPRIVIVTDRINLDDQIWRTFKNCGKQVERADSGRDLAKLIQGQADIITTVIDKFDSVAQAKVRAGNADIFVLVDESHRSQYGAIHAQMKRVFPHACYIGFTGTPLLKKEKSTVGTFGGFIHKYTMRQAVADGAVVPLYYEGRMAELGVEQATIDSWFERYTEDLTPEQKVDLKRKFSRREEISQAEQRIKLIAYDLKTHYKHNGRRFGLKAMLATSSKAAALRYKKLLDDFGDIRSQVVISAPDTREGNEEVDESQTPELLSFWKQILARYGTDEKYNREVVADFARPDGVELLIVVDKLLVGFDEPRCGILYVDKSLKEHALLQAIARVNRIHVDKPHGLIVDYRGMLGELNSALETYNVLEGFDSEDVAGTLTDVSKAIARLPQLQADLWDCFKTVPNKLDVEALQRFLAPEDLRQKFYEALSAYAGALRIALSAALFYEKTPEAQIDQYKRDLNFFHNLRASVARRYGEVIDYADYERRIRKLLDEHIRSAEIVEITPPVDIFQSEAFQAEVDRLTTPASKADTITHQMKRTASAKMDEDPAFYKKFSKLIEETIEAYRQGRLDDLEYLEKSQELLKAFQSGHDAGRPAQLNGYRHAGAYYGILQEQLGTYNLTSGQKISPDLVAEIAIQAEALIEQGKVRDWTTNLDVQKRIKRTLDDYLYDIKRRHGIPLTEGDLDVILDNLVEVAKQRERA